MGLDCVLLERWARMCRGRPLEGSRVVLHITVRVGQRRALSRVARIAYGHAISDLLVSTGMVDDERITLLGKAPCSLVLLSTVRRTVGILNVLEFLPGAVLAGTFRVPTVPYTIGLDYMYTVGLF